MNKQGLIEDIKNIDAVESFMSETVWVKRNDVLALAYQLDEPEKPVVPQYVADWYENHKSNFEFNLYRFCIDYYERELPENLLEWFTNDNNNPIQTLVNMHQFGYEAEKEKLYTVEIPNPNDSVHTILHRTEKGIIISYSTDENYKNIKQNQLTEAEIKQDFEWAWQFAKEVEE